MDRREDPWDTPQAPICDEPARPVPDFVQPHVGIDEGRTLIHRQPTYSGDHVHWECPYEDEGSVEEAREALAEIRAEVRAEVRAEIRAAAR
jgi:hypothetical protein